MLVAIKAAAATQNIENAYFQNVETIVAAATSESEKFCYRIIRVSCSIK